MFAYETRLDGLLWIKADRVAAGVHINDWDAIEVLRSCVLSVAVV